MCQVVIEEDSLPVLFLGGRKKKNQRIAINLQSSK